MPKCFARQVTRCDSSGRARGDASYGEGLFAAVDVGDEMDLYAAGEVETSFNGCVDDGGFFPAGSSQVVPSCVRVNVWVVHILAEDFVRMILWSVSEMSFVKTGDARTFEPEAGMKRQVLSHSDQLMLVRHYFEEGWVGGAA